jgi:CheY-like chemotaxis protein
MGAQPDHKAAFAPANLPQSAAGTRILIAEDHEVGLELTCLMARRLGIEADPASDGYQALQRVKAAAAEGRPYSLVLMDFMMPVIDGIEATRRLRRAGFAAEQLPVIALTAVIEPREIGRFTEAGGQGYLAKPLNLDQLCAALQAWLPQYRIAETGPRVREDDSLLGRYAERKRATFGCIDTALAAHCASAAATAEIRDLLHKLAGTAGLFGEDSLSASAAACEQALIDAEPGEVLEVLRTHRPRLGAAA